MTRKPKRKRSRRKGDQSSVRAQQRSGGRAVTEGESTDLHDENEGEEGFEIGLMLGKTVCVGDMNFVKAEVSLKAVCKDESEVPKTYRRVKRWVKGQLNREIKDLTG